MTRKAGLLALTALAFATVATAASAAEFVTNGGFEVTTLPISAEIGGDFGNVQNAAGWTTDGYNFLFRAGDADTVGATGSFGNLKLWGPGTGAANGLPASSPQGGNFIAADPQFITDSIDQVINGLTIGANYNLSFYWAAAQQFGFDGDTTAGWNVSLGSQTHTTGAVANTNHGFVPWTLANFSFTATAATETLSFLAIGGPSGSQPPFALLDGVSLTNVGVPEPATWGLMILGFGAVGAAVRRRRTLAA